VQVLRVPVLRLQAWASPSMCQEETKVTGTVRIGVALTSGAVFGMIAQTALHHVGLDLAGVHGDLIIDSAARPGLASWVWWFLAIAAFFVGPSSVALTRRFIAHRPAFRGSRLLAWVVLMLTLVTLAHLAPSSLGMTSAPHGFPVVVVSALLAAIGARLARPAGPEGSLSSKPQIPSRASGACPIPRPDRGGSVNSGLPLRGVRRVRSVMAGARTVASVALAIVVPIVALAAVSALSSAAVVRELVAPAAIRGPVVKQTTRQAPRAQVLALTEPAGADPRAAAAAIRPEPVRAAPPPVRQPAVRVALANPRAPMSASELTFAKGYAKRRAALQATTTALASPAPEIKLPANLKSRATASRTERYDRSHRRATYVSHASTQRYGGYERYAHYDRINDGR
jgi:hypothetical protein